VTATELVAAQDAANLIREKTGVVVPVTTILSHFEAEGTTQGYNYAGLGPGWTFSSPAAFARAYAATVSSRIESALQQGALQRGEVVSDPALYAAILQYAGPKPYCASGCGAFYQAGAAYAPLFGKIPFSSGVFTPVVGPKTTVSEAAQGGANSEEPSSPGASPNYGIFTGLINWISQVAGRALLVLVLVVAALIVFAANLRGEIRQVE
jgi:hypothetical protein